MGWMIILGSAIGAVILTALVSNYFIRKEDGGKIKNKTIKAHQSNKNERKGVIKDIVIETLTVFCILGGVTLLALVLFLTQVAV